MIGFLSGYLSYVPLLAATLSIASLIAFFASNSSLLGGAGMLVTGAATGGVMASADSLPGVVLCVISFFEDLLYG